jgi:superfamily II DNA/RNA helicase
VSTTFAGLGLPPTLVTALERRGVTTPFPIQAAALPDALGGRDVLGRGQTGSGKTLAFGLPLLARISAGARGRRDRRPGTPRALVLVPTRELAAQVDAELAPLGQTVGLRTRAIFGGAPTGRQIGALRNGVDVVVATPGRLQDLVDRRECDLSAVEVVVLDEADHMCDLGFLPAVTRLLDLVPPGGQRLLFSATLDGGVDKLVRRYLVDPVTHSVDPPDSQVTTMDHLFLTMSSTDKPGVAAQVARRPGRTLFFVRTKHGADRLGKQLGRAGVTAGVLHGDKAQNSRQRTLAAFGTGGSGVLVATDVAARGIHVDGIDLVVHYDPPGEAKAYLHRSGRTARAGASGAVVTFVTPEQTGDVLALRREAGVGEASVADVTPGDASLDHLPDSAADVVRREETPPPASRSAARSGGSRSGGGRSGGRSGGRASGPGGHRPAAAHTPEPSGSPRGRRRGGRGRRPAAA